MNDCSSSVSVKAARAFEREQTRRESQRQKEEAAREKQRERRQLAIARAQAALDKSEQEHAQRVTTIEAERDALAKKNRRRRTSGGRRKRKNWRGLSAGRGVIDCGRGALCNPDHFGRRARR
jgi:hypothetical protein